MTGEDMIRAIGNLSDVVIALPERRGAKSWVKWAALAAGVCLIAGAAALILPWWMNSGETEICETTTEYTVVDQPETEVADHSEVMPQWIVRNNADEYRPTDYGEADSVLTYSDTKSSFEPFGFSLLPDEVLKPTVFDSGAVLVDRPTEVEVYTTVYRAEYLYTGADVGEIAVTAESTAHPQIGDRPSDFYYNNVRLSCDVENLSRIGATGNAIVAETDDFVYAQMVAYSPEQSGDEITVRYALLTFRFDKGVTDEQILGVLRDCEHLYQLNMS